METGLATYPDRDVPTGLAIDDLPVVWDVRAVPTGLCRDRAVPAGEAIADDGLLDPPTPAPAPAPAPEDLPTGDVLPLGVVAGFEPWAVREDSRPVPEPLGVANADELGCGGDLTLRAEGLRLDDDPWPDIAPDKMLTSYLPLPRYLPFACRRSFSPPPPPPPPPPLCPHCHRVDPLASHQSLKSSIQSLGEMGFSTQSHPRYARSPEGMLAGWTSFQVKPSIPIDSQTWMPGRVEFFRFTSSRF